jgi:4-amino-4-deoxy-L-arabinose transferase-like glycosyltransferase
MWALVLVALVVRLAAVAATPNYSPGSDPLDYERYALAIQNGHFPQRPAGDPGPTAYRPPLYPLFLGAMYRISPVDQRLWARVAQALVGALTVLLAGSVARGVFGRRVAMVTMAIAALWPPMWMFGAAFLSEVLIVPLSLGAIAAVLYSRRTGAGALRWALLAGVLAGLAALTRMNAALLLLPLTMAMWPRRGARRSLRGYAMPAALVAAALLTVAPWTIRNAVVLDHFVPVSTEDGFTLAGTYNDVARRQTRFPAAWVEWYKVPSNKAVLRVTPNTEAEWGDALRADALRYAREHPGYVVKVAWWNLRRVFDAGGIDRLRFEYGDDGLPTAFGVVEFASFWPIALLALVGVATPLRRRVPLWLWLVPLTMLAAVVVVGYMRFRAPIDPFIAMFAAVGATALWDRFRRRRRFQAA